MPQEIICASNRIYRELNNQMNNIYVNKVLYGKEFRQYNVSSDTNKLMSRFRFDNNNYSKAILTLDHYIDDILTNGLMTELFYQNEGYSQIELPSFERLISDCAKLKKLDELLTKLSKENHRVLIFCQMTRMIDILEEYMAKRRYTYFRMDGSTNIADRRDMVNEFQVNDKIFAFLLSTRAGGLGVNLTGADTVIFYDNDWNPTMDAQATDRAHRIGQTKMVTVYRLITKGTIEERILKRAKQKQNVQTTVYAGGAFKADIFKQSEIVELLYTEEEVKKMEAERKRLQLEYNNLEGGDDKKKKKNKNAKTAEKGKKGDKEKTPLKESATAKNAPRTIFSVSSNPKAAAINALKVDR
jgi:SNF2 family DNA or RNA helicase